MTSEKIRELYGNNFLNDLTAFLDDARQFDEPPERFCKRLIIWLDERGYAIARLSNIASLMGEIR